MKRFGVIPWLLVLSVPLFAQTLDWTAIPSARIQIVISEQTEQGQFNDSLYFTPAQWAQQTVESIATAKKARVDNWVAFVKSASTQKPLEPTKDDLLQQKADLEKRLVDVTARITAIDKAVVEK